MKRQRITIGSIVEIIVDNNYYCYAQILGKASYAFFDYRSKKQLKDLDALSLAPVLFIISVYDDVVTKGHWLKVGKMDMRDDFKIFPLQFVQDVMNHSKYSIYNPNTGEMRDAKREECINLECAAVWEAKHVEIRLRDYYNRNNNSTVENLSLK